MAKSGEDEGILSMVFVLGIAESEYGAVVSNATLASMVEDLVYYDDQRTNWLMDFDEGHHILQKSNEHVLKNIEAAYYDAISYEQLLKISQMTAYPLSVNEAIDEESKAFEKRGTLYTSLDHWMASFAQLYALVAGNLRVRCLQPPYQSAAKFTATIKGENPNVTYHTLYHTMTCPYCGELTTMLLPHCTFCLLPFSIEQVEEINLVLTAATKYSRDYEKAGIQMSEGMERVGSFIREQHSAVFLASPPISGKPTLDMDVLDPRTTIYNVERIIAYYDMLTLGQTGKVFNAEQHRFRVLLDRIRYYPNILLPRVVCMPIAVSTSMALDVPSYTPTETVLMAYEPMNQEEQDKNIEKMKISIDAGMPNAEFHELTGVYQFNDFVDPLLVIYRYQQLLEEVDHFERRGGFTTTFVRRDESGNKEYITGFSKIESMFYEGFDGLNLINNILAIVNAQMNAAICLQLGNSSVLSLNKYVIVMPEYTSVSPFNILRAIRSKVSATAPVGELLSELRKTTGEFAPYANLRPTQGEFAINMLFLGRLMKCLYNVKTVTEAEPPRISRVALFHLFANQDLITLEYLDQKFFISPIVKSPGLHWIVTHHKVLSFDIHQDGNILPSDTSINKAIVTDFANSEVTFVMYVEYTHTIYTPANLTTTPTVVFIAAQSIIAGQQLIGEILRYFTIKQRIEDSNAGLLAITKRVYNSTWKRTKLVSLGNTDVYANDGTKVKKYSFMVSYHKSWIDTCKAGRYTPDSVTREIESLDYYEPTKTDFLKSNLSDATTSISGRGAILAAVSAFLEAYVPKFNPSNSTEVVQRTKKLFWNWIDF